MISHAKFSVNNLEIIYVEKPLFIGNCEKAKKCDLTKCIPSMNICITS